MKSAPFGGANNDGCRTLGVGALGSYLSPKSHLPYNLCALAS